MKTKLISGKIVIAIFAMLLANGCASLISNYDQYAYTQATSLKVDVSNLILKSKTDQYSAHEPDVQEVLTKLNKAIEYERHRKGNDITIKMWKTLDGLLIDTTLIQAPVPFVHGYFPRWKANGRIESAMGAAEADSLIGKGFDLIAELESKKIKPDNNIVTAFLEKFSKK